MRRENSSVTREPRVELARATLVGRDPRLVYTRNGVLDMTRKRISRKTLIEQAFYLRVQAWRNP